MRHLTYRIRYKLNTIAARYILIAAAFCLFFFFLSYLLFALETNARAQRETNLHFSDVYRIEPFGYVNGYLNRYAGSYRSAGTTSGDPATIALAAVQQKLGLEDTGRFGNFWQLFDHSAAQLDLAGLDRLVRTWLATEERFYYRDTSVIPETLVNDLALRDDYYDEPRRLGYSVSAIVKAGGFFDSHVEGSVFLARHVNTVQLFDRIKNLLDLADSYMISERYAEANQVVDYIAGWLRLLNVPKGSSFQDQVNEVFLLELLFDEFQSLTSRELNNYYLNIRAIQDHGYDMDVAAYDKAKRFFLQEEGKPELGDSCERRFIVNALARGYTRERVVNLTELLGSRSCMRKPNLREWVQFQLFTSEFQYIIAAYCEDGFACQALAGRQDVLDWIHTGFLQVRNTNFAVNHNLVDDLNETIQLADQYGLLPP